MGTEIVAGVLMVNRNDSAGRAFIDFGYCQRFQY